MANQVLWSGRFGAGRGAVVEKLLGSRVPAVNLRSYWSRFTGVVARLGDKSRSYFVSAFWGVGCGSERLGIEWPSLDGGRRSDVAQHGLERLGRATRMGSLKLAALFFPRAAFSNNDRTSGGTTSYEIAFHERNSRRVRRCRHLPSAGE